jgi:hypothetical protein
MVRRFLRKPLPGGIGAEYHCSKQEMKHEKRFDHRYRLCFFDYPLWLLRGTEA